MTYSDDEIIGALNNILASEIFRSSERASTFLKYVTIETLEGRAEQLNGTTIAQDVFDKGADFDPSQDTLIRVTARRIRSMLRDYYISHPNQDPLIITIPKGGYKAKFKRNVPISIEQTTSLVPRKNSKFNLLAGVIFAALIGVVGLYVFKPHDDLTNTNNITASVQTDTLPFGRESSQYPLIKIGLFENQTENSKYDFLERGLQKTFVKDISQFQIVRPVAFDSRKSQNVPKVANNQPSFDYAISGGIISVEPNLDFFVSVESLEDKSEIYRHRIRQANTGPEYFENLSKIVSEITNDFDGVEGGIVQKSLTRIEQRINADKYDLSNIEKLKCLLSVDDWKLNPKPSLAGYKLVYSCLETLLKQSPDDATLLANFGVVSFIGANVPKFVYDARSINPDLDAEQALDMMKRAVEIDPENGTAREIISAAIVMANGDKQEALNHAAVAYFSNPGDADYICWISRRLAAVGDWERALTLGRECRERVVDISGKYYRTDFAWAMLNEDKEDMRRLADIIKEQGDYYDRLIDFLAAVANDDNVRIEALSENDRAWAVGDTLKSVDWVFQNDEVRMKAYLLLVKSGKISEAEIESHIDKTPKKSLPVTDTAQN
ncbi:tetratricopeptide repeat protein [Hellea sp.]|nr:tetratricopeptide repeat protein [Hellea sp.]